MNNNKQQSNSELMRYAGMGTQFLVAIGLGIFFGLKLDEWLHLPFPLLVWLLPLVIIIGLIIKLIIETSKK
ncbi:MAG: AtpZ/AtpI family protein [Ginsengibacter sp.]